MFKILSGGPIQRQHALARRVPWPALGGLETPAIRGSNDTLLRKKNNCEGYIVVDHSGMGL
jgi:hypothetical protein